MATLFRLSNKQLGFFFAALAGTAVAQAAPVRCPDTLHVDQRARDMAAGVQAFEVADPHRWVGVRFSDGPPDEQAWLVPDGARKVAKTTVSTWRFSHSSGGAWLSCVYSGTSIVASIRLPGGTSMCEVVYNDDLSPPAASTIDCR
jgi:hypothetical protein